MVFSNDASSFIVCLLMARDDDSFHQSLASNYQCNLAYNHAIVRIYAWHVQSFEPEYAHYAKKPLIRAFVTAPAATISGTSNPSRGVDSDQYIEFPSRKLLDDFRTSPTRLNHYANTHLNAHFSSSRSSPRTSSSLLPVIKDTLVSFLRKLPSLIKSSICPLLDELPTGVDGVSSVDEMI